jgi:hypothetical protein
MPQKAERVGSKRQIEIQTVFLMSQTSSALSAVATASFTAAFYREHHCRNCAAYQNKTENEMILNTKSDCVESITDILKKTSEWRKNTALRFPDDNRNGKAAKTLDRLSTEAANLTDAQWAELKAHFSWSSENWRTILTQTARQAAFHHRFGDLETFIRILLDNLSVLSVAA